jgi:nicotinate-nucleotide pyrophosphorylase (carboxylating)
MLGAPRRALIVPLIRRALAEDRARQDVTSQRLVPAQARCRARIVARESGVLAGGPMLRWTFQALDRRLRCTLKAREGASLRRGQIIAMAEGPARSILAAERTALNLLGHLSGIATLTDAFVHRARGTRAQILDTRKTLPGLRALEKYAVRAGGGASHRSDLSEAALIKTNHLRLLRRAVRGGAAAIRRAVQAARRGARTFVQVEVRNLAEFRAALAAGPDAILLDNWSLEAIRTAGALRRSRAMPRGRRSPVRPLLEVSGGVHLRNVGVIARTGVERISIGRLTHSAPALDVALEVI